MCVPWTQRVWKTYYIIKGTCIPISVTSIVLHYEQLCRALTSANDEIFL